MSNEELKTENKEQSKNEVMNKMNDLLDLNDIAELVKNNEKVFELNGVTYRIKKPTFKQRQETYKKRIEKYTELLKDEKYLLERDLKELYKKRGIDVDKIEIELKNKAKRRDEFMVKLGGEIKNNASEDTLQLLKKEIEQINLEIQELVIEKSTLLEISIEQQLNIYVYSYFTYLLAEKKEDENWVKVWNNYSEYENGDQELINLFSYYSTMLLGSEGI